MEKRNIIILMISLSIILLFGTSYAVLKVTKESENPYTISVGALNVEFEDGLTQNLNIDNMYPMSDEEGMKQEKELSFSVINNGTIEAYYDVYIEETSTNPEFKSHIRFASNKNDTGYNDNDIKNLENDKYIDENANLEEKNRATYKVKLWLDYDAGNEYMNQIFKAKLVIKAHQGDKKTLDQSGSNYPETFPNLIPVYYKNGKILKADIDNLDENNTWYNYGKNNLASAVTIKKDKKIMVDKTYNNILNPWYPCTKLDNGNFYFDGVDDFLNLGHANENLGNTVTLVARFKINKLLSGEQDIIGNFETSGTAIEINSSNKIAFYIHHDGKYYNISSNEVAQENKWYTVVGIYNNSELQLYINGESANAPVSVTGEITKSPVPFMLGANPDVDGYGSLDFSNVEIEKCLVYKRAVDVEEVKKNFTGSISEYSTSELLIDTKDYNDVEDIFSKYSTDENNNLILDGQDDFFYLGNKGYNFKDSISVIVRIKFDKIDGGVIICNTEYGGFEIVISDMKPYVNVHINGNYTKALSNQKIELNTWYTLVATYDNQKVKLYINAIPDAELNITGPITVSEAPILIGANPRSRFPVPEGYYTSFTMSDAFVYTDTLTEEEIEKYFKDEITDYPKDNILIAYNGFAKIDASEAYLKTKKGQEIESSYISSTFEWIPRYKLQNDKIKYIWKTENIDTRDIAFNYNNRELLGYWVTKDNVNIEDLDTNKFDFHDTTSNETNAANKLKGTSDTYTKSVCVFGD